MKKSQIFTLLAIFICLLIYFFIPSINTWINKSVAVLSSLSIEKVIEFLRSYGKTAAIVSFVLMVLAAVLAPIPQFLITLSNAAIFGWIGGAALSWTSAMAGAALCFFIAKYLGRDAVEKIVSKKCLIARMHTLLDMESILS